MKRQKKYNKYTQADMIQKNTQTRINPKVSKILQAAAFTSMMASMAGGSPYMEIDADSELGKTIQEMDTSNGDDK